MPSNLQNSLAISNVLNIEASAKQVVMGVKTLGTMTKDSLLVDETIEVQHAKVVNIETTIIEMIIKRLKAGITANRVLKDLNVTVVTAVGSAEIETTAALRATMEEMIADGVSLIDTVEMTA